jgi:hypothetical protein
MASADHDGQLGGHVEIDETYVGGRQSRAERKAKGTNKTIVMGIVSRDGDLRAGPIPADTKSVMEPIVYRHVEPGSIVSTDMHASYEDLSATYLHGRVDHKAEEYVRGAFHTNTLEGHWSLFKRAVKGTHVSISSQHMWKYVCEFSYRRNFRASHRLMFDRLVVSLSLPRLAET